MAYCLYHRGNRQYHWWRIEELLKAYLWITGGIVRSGPRHWSQARSLRDLALYGNIGSAPPRRTIKIMSRITSTVHSPIKRRSVNVETGVRFRGSLCHMQNGSRCTHRNPSATQPSHHSTRPYQANLTSAANGCSIFSYARQATLTAFQRSLMSS
jgi:hypothetical protein